jgi:hypothetical protein
MLYRQQTTTVPHCSSIERKGINAAAAVEKETDDLRRRVVPGHSTTREEEKTKKSVAATTTGGAAAALLQRLPDRPVRGSGHYGVLDYTRPEKKGRRRK